MGRKYNPLRALAYQTACRFLDENYELICQLCQEYHAVFRVHNDGHHWYVQRGNVQLNWWPASSLLLVRQRQFGAMREIGRHTVPNAMVFCETVDTILRAEVAAEAPFDPNVICLPPPADY